MSIREKIARACAKAQTDADPDTRVFCYEPARILDGCKVAPDPSHTMPLWTRYLPCADAALATIQKELEVSGIIVAWSKD